MDLEHFIKNYSQDTIIARQVALYCVKPDNLAPNLEKKHYVRCGLGGGRETANIDRSVTPSGQDSRASSLYSRMAMYWNNWINSGTIICALILPRSVVMRPTGPTIARILQEVNPDDNRPAYALKGKTQGAALEQIYHINLDKMSKVKRSRTNRVEWFETTQNDFKNIKLGMQSVGQGWFVDFTKFPRNVMPEQLKGIRLSGGQVLDVTEHEFRKSPRLLQNVQKEVEEEDGTVRLSSDDIEDIRMNTIRGQQILELITRKGPKSTREVQTTNVQTRSKRTQSHPIQVRLTRSQVDQLREAYEDTNQRKRQQRLARVLANLN